MIDYSMDIKSLATADEIKEVNVTLQNKVEYKPTFIQCGIQFYRIIGPKGHPHLGSDLSIDGMKDWRII